MKNSILYIFLWMMGVPFLILVVLWMLGMGFN
jgi:hypothetical protein